MKIEKKIAVLILIMISLSSAYVISDDGQQACINTSNYQACLTTNTGYTSWGYVGKIYSNAYNSNAELSGNYIADYIRLIEYNNPNSQTSSTLRSLYTPVDYTILENGSQRASVVFNYQNTVYLTWHFYDEFYIGSIKTGALAGSDDGYDTLFVLNDTNNTDSGSFGYDNHGLKFVYGSKSNSAVNSHTATASGTYDAFDQNANYWVSWYGSNAGDLAIGRIGRHMVSGSTDSVSAVYDIETLGSDYFFQKWYRKPEGLMDNYNQMFTVSIPYSGANYTYVKNFYSVYQNPATVTAISNATSDGFQDREFIYRLKKTPGSGNIAFNVTGNANWDQAVEKIYFEILNVSDSNNLYKRSGGAWNLILESSLMQYDANASMYDAVFYINAGKSSNDAYLFGTIGSSPTTPTSITCDSGTCNSNFSGNVAVNCSGSTDTDEITYVIEAKLINSTVITNSTYVNVKIAQLDLTSRTCSDAWGFDCGAACGTENDNTYDACSNCDNTDERINEIYLNQTVADVGSQITAICEYYTTETTADEMYVYYRNSSSETWKQIAAGSSSGTGSTIRNWTTQTINLDNITGTHQIRCIIDYTGEADECAGGIYFDNDDVNITVIEEGITSTFWTTYNNVDADHNSTSLISVKVEVDSYNPSGSHNQNQRDPDLQLEIYNGNDWIEIGNFSLNSSYQGVVLNTTNANFTISTSDSNILTAWQAVENQDVRIRGIEITNYDSNIFDEINYTNIWISINGRDWKILGNHTDSAVLTWNTSTEPDQTDVDLKCRAIDIYGSNFYSNYYNPAINLTIESAETATLLAIWDETDSITKYEDEEVKFYANYTLANSTKITGAICNTIFNISGSWTSPFAMTYNATSTNYEYSRSFASIGTFNWNATCSASGYQTSTSTDTFAITTSANITNCDIIINCIEGISCAYSTIYTTKITSNYGEEKIISETKVCYS